MRRLLRLGTPALVSLAWRYRDELADWIGFGLRSAKNLVEGEPFDDVKAEARLRVALTRDRETRSAPVQVDVREGVARVRGRVNEDVRERILDLIEDTPGIRDVDESRLRVRGRRRIGYRASANPS